MRAQCCRQFGGILRERNRFREASGYLEAALRIYELQGSGWEVIDWAVTEQEAGMIHRNAGRHTDALACYERAGDLVVGGGSAGLEEHVVFRAMLRRDVGIVAQDRGDLDTAERELTAAHEVFRTKRGEEDFETAQVAKFLADVLRRKGQQCKAASRRTRNPLRKRGLRAQAQTHLTRAHDLLCPVVALLGKRRTTEAHTYAACLNKLGSLQYAQGHIHKALNHPARGRGDLRHRVRTGPPLPRQDPLPARPRTARGGRSRRRRARTAHGRAHLRRQPGRGPPLARRGVRVPRGLRPGPGAGRGAAGPRHPDPPVALG